MCLWQAFSHFDRDSDHRLSPEELCRAFDEMNLQVTQTEVNNILNKILPDFSKPLKIQVSETVLERCVATFHMEPGAKGIKYFEFVRALSEACEWASQTILLE